MQFFAISSLITAITSIFLGFLVFLKNKKNPINIIFGFFTISVFIWSFSYVIWLLQSDPESALFWARMLNFGATLIPIAYLHWIIVFLKKQNQKKYKIILFIGYLLTLIYSLFSFSDYYIYDVAQMSIFPYWPQANWLYYCYLATNYTAIVIYGSYLLYKNLKYTTGFQKEQAKYAFIGSIIGFIGGASNFPLMLGFSLFPPIGNPLVIAYPIFFAYAIIKHRLMDIKFILRKSTIFLFSLFFLLTPAIILKYLFIVYLNYYSSLTDILILIFSITFYPTLQKYFSRLSNKYFFTSLYDTQKVIAELSDKLRSTLETDIIYEIIYETLNKALHFKAFGVLPYDQKTKAYVVHYNKGFALGTKKKFPSNSELQKLFVSQNKNIIVEEIKTTFNTPGTKDTIKMLEDLGVAILTPLNVKDKTIGLIALGQKESGDMYNDEDLQVLNITGSQAAIAIENALSYGQIVNFNLKLKKEVDIATKDLKSANLKLTKLDQAKSEFISIASHQLRTPLTVIKGYVSMILENNFGELDLAKRESLEKVYESNERLIQLVENLLNISRIESGRLQFSYEIMDIQKIVDSVMEELTGYAVKKGLKLIYKKPEKPLPLVNIDEEKMRQVIMNLIDNSIKYTKKGTVTVTLKVNKNNIDFCVSDTGMGIRPEDLPNLFKKFSRGTGTSVVHTEGTGLGLYVADQMIKFHKGKVWAESEGQDKGAKFCFLLPIYKNSIFCCHPGPRSGIQK